MPDPLASAKRFEAEVCKLAFRIDAPVEKMPFLGAQIFAKSRRFVLYWELAVRLGRGYLKISRFKHYLKISKNCLRIYLRKKKSRHLMSLDFVLRLLIISAHIFLEPELKLDS